MQIIFQLKIYTFLVSLCFAVQYAPVSGFANSTLTSIFHASYDKDISRNKNKSEDI